MPHFAPESREDNLQIPRIGTALPSQIENAVSGLKQFVAAVTELLSTKSLGSAAPLPSAVQILLALSSALHTAKSLCVQQPQQTTPDDKEKDKEKAKEKEKAKAKERRWRDGLSGRRVS